MFSPAEPIDVIGRAGEAGEHNLVRFDLFHRLGYHRYEQPIDLRFVRSPIVMWDTDSSYYGA
jgi:ribosomal protein S28E/S33